MSARSAVTCRRPSDRPRREEGRGDRRSHRPRARVRGTRARHARVRRALLPLQGRHLPSRSRDHEGSLGRGGDRRRHVRPRASRARAARARRQPASMALPRRRQPLLQPPSPQGTGHLDARGCDRRDRAGRGTLAVAPRRTRGAPACRARGDRHARPEAEGRRRTPLPEGPQPRRDRAGRRLPDRHGQVPSPLRPAAPASASCGTSRARLRTARCEHGYTWTDTPHRRRARARATGVTDHMACRQTQERIAVLLAGAADRRERLEIESHTSACARCATAYRDYIATSVALDRAYAPLRHATVALSPARVRLAMRVPEPVPAPVRFSRVVARVNEFALAAAVTAFAFVGAGSVAPKPAITDEAVPSDVLDPAVSPRSLADETPPATPERAGLLR